MISVNNSRYNGVQVNLTPLEETSNRPTLEPDDVISLLMEVIVLGLSDKKRQLEIRKTLTDFANNPVIFIVKPQTSKEFEHLFTKEMIRHQAMVDEILQKATKFIQDLREAVKTLSVHSKKELLQAKRVLQNQHDQIKLQLSRSETNLKLRLQQLNDQWNEKVKYLSSEMTESQKLMFCSLALPFSSAALARAKIFLENDDIGVDELETQLNVLMEKQQNNNSIRMRMKDEIEELRLKEQRANLRLRDMASVLKDKLLSLYNKQNDDILKKYDNINKSNSIRALINMEKKYDKKRKLTYLLRFLTTQKKRNFHKNLQEFVLKQSKTLTV